MQSRIFLLHDDEEKHDSRDIVDKIYETSTSNDFLMSSEGLVVESKLEIQAEIKE